MRCHVKNANSIRWRNGRETERGRKIENNGVVEGKQIVIHAGNNEGQIINSCVHHVLGRTYFSYAPDTFESLP